MMSTDRRPLRHTITAALIAVVLVGCGSDGNDMTAAPESSDVGSDDVAPNSSVTTETSSDITAQGPLGIRLVAELGYPRDLLERGRVNIVVTREGSTEFVILTKQLQTTFFESAEPESRPTVIPPDRRRVALQTTFGTVDQCGVVADVAARLDVTYTFGDDTVRNASFPIADAAVLDQIRAQECAARRILDENEVAVVDAVVDGERIDASLTIIRRTGDDRLDIASIVGTVLVGATSTAEAGDPTRILDPDERRLDLPLSFVVNRCDPHAVAETTKKFGLELWIATDGGEPLRVPIPVDNLLEDFETVVERCAARTAD